MELLAQATGKTSEMLMSLLGALGGVGFSIWYGWYTTTKTLPRVQEKHDELIRILVTAFQDEQRSQRAFQQEQMDGFWAKHDQEVQQRQSTNLRIIKSLERLATTDNHRPETGEKS